MTVFDLLLNEDDDLDIQGGDLVAGESTRQHQSLLLLTEPGEWRETPATGVGIRTLILDEAPSAAVTSEIQAQFEADGLIVDYIYLATGGALDLAAYYRALND